MTEKITAIVLDITRHNDKLNVVTLYTRNRGRIAFLSPVGGGKAGRLRQARLQPLAVIEADINFRQTSELQRLSLFSLHTVWTDLYFHPIKRIIILFLSEFLNKLLRATMPDENLWDYIYNSLLLLDRMESGISDFHIVFLSSLLSFVGIQPDPATYHPGFIFNMESGTFFNPSLLTHNPTTPFLLIGENARLAAILCRINFSNIRALHLSGNLRNRILKNLLKYYSIHFPGSGNLKSLDVIHDIFH